MDSKEIVIRFRWLMMEADTLLIQADTLFQIEKLYDSLKDPDAKQIISCKKYIQSLREKAEQLLSCCEQFENILDLLKDDPERIICRKYYALGLTDEEIASQVHMHQSTVCRIRQKALEKLEI